MVLINAQEGDELWLYSFRKQKMAVIMAAATGVVRSLNVTPVVFMLSSQFLLS